MLLTLSTTHQPATDLGYLLHKHPNRLQSFDLSFGKVHVFYPEVSEEMTTAALLIDMDPVGLVRGKQRNQSSLLGHYVNDRAYVASSFLSVAISQVFGSALSGHCKNRPELVRKPIPLAARLDVLPVRSGEDWLRRLFEPLGYSVEAQRHPLDEQFPDWGESPYYSVTLRGVKTLSELLTHLYVLVPVFDNEKHYFVGEDEIEKLLSKGTGWLAEHPERTYITRRYLRYRSNLYREALVRLVEDEPPNAEEAQIDASPTDNATVDALSLNEQRHGAVLAALRASGARSVLDLGCGEGRLLRQIMAERQFERIVGLDVAMRTLEVASKRLKLDRLGNWQSERIKLIHGSLTYRDDRLSGFDAAAVVEVIEHLDPPRLSAFEKVLFEHARPKTIVITTPNREYNVMWEGLPAGEFRHRDHRFEWARQEFQDWGKRVAESHGYTVRFLSVGPEDTVVGSPTQMGIFEVARESR